MEGLMVTCPLTPYTSHLLSSSCSSPRSFGLSFLQTPPRDDALALLLTFGSANTWYRDSHPTRLVPCPAHTFNSVDRLVLHFQPVFFLQPPLNSPIAGKPLGHSQPLLKSCPHPFRECRWTSPMAIP